MCGKPHVFGTAATVLRIFLFFAVADTRAGDALSYTKSVVCWRIETCLDRLSYLLV
jgi:hypothetical protein